MFWSKMQCIWVADFALQIQFLNVSENFQLAFLYSRVSVTSFTLCSLTFRFLLSIPLLIIPFLTVPTLEIINEM